MKNIDTMRFGSFDLGTGIRVSVCPKWADAMIPNGFVVATTVFKFDVPETDDMGEFDFLFKCHKINAHALVKKLDALNIPAGTDGWDEIVAPVVEAFIESIHMVDPDVQACLNRYA